jgi:hypothetical protein
MNFEQYLNEVAAKDWDRMQTLINKKSDGASVAKSIKDKTKAIDRYVAGLKLTDTALTKPPFKGEFADFGNKAIELGATYEDIKKAYDAANPEDAGKDSKEEAWVPKKRESSKEPHRFAFGRPSAILSIGTLSLKTGKSKYFNVYEEWGEDSTYEIWEMENGKYRIVVTSGKKPIYDIGDRSAFKGDQSGRDLGVGELVDWASGTELKKLAKHYGGSIPAFVYK